MLSTLEKKQRLRGVNLFAETPDDILEEVARLLEEVVCPAGTTLFEQGDFGDAMYIILEGRVRVHSGGRTLTVLEQGSVFGEMAALDPEPRSASVTALENLRLLRLERVPFTKLITSRPEITTGVIHILCQTLRARTGAMVEDYQYLQQVAQLTAAASEVEAGIYQPEAIENVTQRSDALGQLARVFQRMIREVYTREQRLQQQVQELRIKVDKARQAQQVDKITGTDYFQQLRNKAGKLRNQLQGTDAEDNQT
ncbi:MAG: cyclic nucleotide-binding domain-containing protein [Caldilineaceae bacterium]